MSIPKTLLNQVVNAINNQEEDTKPRFSNTFGDMLKAQYAEAFAQYIAESRNEDIVKKIIPEDLVQYFINMNRRLP